MCRSCSSSLVAMYAPTVQEQVANIITHLVPILPSLLGGIYLVQNSVTQAEATVCLLYGFFLLLLFVTSTVFHVLSLPEKKGSLHFFFHVADRVMIFLFISASYTPWIVLRDHSMGDLYIWGIWAFGTFGCVYSYVFYQRYAWLELVLYVTLGVGPSIAITTMDDFSGVPEVAVGGLIYILGIGFLNSDGKIPYAHAIWHCFTNVAAALHFYAVATHLIGKDTDTTVIGQ